MSASARKIAELATITPGFSPKPAERRKSGPLWRASSGLHDPVGIEDNPVARPDVMAQRFIGGKAEGGEQERSSVVISSDCAIIRTGVSGTAQSQAVHRRLFMRPASPGNSIDGQPSEQALA
jgi:hypothetical protein